MILLCALLVMGGESDQEQQWRDERLKALTSETGWLNVIGLYWLTEGENKFGTDQDLPITLPKFSTVPHAGTLTVNGNTASFTMERAQLAKVNGQETQAGVIGLGPPPDVLAHNHLRMFLIVRDDKLALRVRDLRAKAVTEFKGIEYYKAKKSMIVEAEFTPFERVEETWVSTVIGTHELMQVPGKLTFELDEQTLELTPFIEEDEEGKRLFIMFKDLTSGHETYPSGRYLKAAMPEEGAPVILNFNRAYNPPCAFTDFATCPLPPADNWLDVAIEAGEKYMSDSHE